MKSNCMWSVGLIPAATDDITVPFNRVTFTRPIGPLALASLYCGLGLGIAGATWGSSDDLTKGNIVGNGVSMRTELESE
jgi:hypothetical protein